MAHGGANRRIPSYFLYGEAPRRVAGPLLHVETIEARSARHQWKIDPHQHHGLHQIILVLRGRGVTMTDGARAQYQPPALMLIPAATVHGFEFEPGTRGYVVTVSDQLQHELQRREPALATLFSHPLMLEPGHSEMRATDLALSAHALAREFLRTDSGHQLALNGLLQVLLSSVMRLVKDQPNPADPVVWQRRTLVERFIGLVEKRYRRSRTVGSYATFLKVSPSRLRSVCLDLTGQSPMQLIHSRIMLEAKRRLHYTDSGITKIASALGFRDAAYFTRFFTRRAGVSPRSFRQNGPEYILSGESSKG